MITAVFFFLAIITWIFNLLFGGFGGNTGSNTDNLVPYGLQASCNVNDDSKFNICLDLVSGSGESQPWMSSLEVARERWEEIIVQDHPGNTIALSDLPNPCSGYPSMGFIDDVYICARDTFIDGFGGVLGSARYTSAFFFDLSPLSNPKTSDGTYGLPVMGELQLDQSDVNNLFDAGQLVGLVEHEIGHIMGIGTLWEENGLYQQGTGEYESGTFAAAAWNDITSCNAPIPVELGGGAGTADVHWDELCLKDELMTGALTGDLTFSAVTIGSLKDMGFGVDETEAASYTSADVTCCNPTRRRRTQTRVRNLRRTLQDEGESTTTLPPRPILSPEGFAAVKAYAIGELENAGSGELAENEIPSDVIDVIYQEGAEIYFVAVQVE